MKRLRFGLVVGATWSFCFSAHASPITEPSIDATVVGFDEVFVDIDTPVSDEFFEFDVRFSGSDAHVLPGPGSFPGFADEYLSTSHGGACSAGPVRITFRSRVTEAGLWTVGFPFQSFDPVTVRMISYRDGAQVETHDVVTALPGAEFLGLEDANGFDEVDILAVGAANHCVFMDSVSFIRSCGNFVIDPWETCDDNAGYNSMTCDYDCTAPSCGDGVLNEIAGEGCEESSDTFDCNAGNCSFSVCGDAYHNTASGEACDEGDDTVDCDFDCTLPACGDEYFNPQAEECDDSPFNSDTEPDACRSNCVFAYCGDGVVDSAESCDDADANSDTLPDACRTNCALASCGDGVQDDGEACDDGELNDDSTPDACRTTCVAARCGDGVVDEGEACDDGRRNSDTNPDACRSTCVEPRCGDGVVDGGEECDDADANNDREPGACRSDCSAPRCGDGVVDPGEACDGETDCSADCTADPVGTSGGAAESGGEGSTAGSGGVGSGSGSGPVSATDPTSEPGSTGGRPSEASSESSAGTNANDGAGGCRTGGRNSATWLLLALVVAIRRRRRDLVG